MDEKEIENSNEPIDENAHVFKTIEARPIHFADDANFFPKNPFFFFFGFLAIVICAIIILPFGFIFQGFRLKGRKNFRKVKGGAICIANHINPTDAFLLATTFIYKRIWVTSLESNFGLPFVGKLIRILGAVPLPTTREGMRNFSKQMEHKLKKGNRVAIFPEASLWPYCDHIRPFKKGAFRFAMQNDVPLIPMVWTFHKPRGIFKLIKRKPCMHLNVLEPYYPTKEASKAETLEKAMNEMHQIMSDFFESHTNFKYVKKEKK